MLEPLHIENEEFLVHTFRAEDIKKQKVVSKDILVLSDGSPPISCRVKS